MCGGVSFWCKVIVECSDMIDCEFLLIVVVVIVVWYCFLFGFVYEVFDLFVGVVYVCEMMCE